jgi:hypothetical protein
MNAVAELTRQEQLKRVKPASLQMSEHAYARYSVVLPVGWDLDDVLDPEAWAHVAHKFEKTKLTNEPDRSGAIIEIRTEDHAFYAELYVRAVRNMALDVQAILGPVKLGPQAEKQTAGFDVRWNVGSRGFDIIRQADKVVVAKGLPKKEDAHAWIEQTVG